MKNLIQLLVVIILLLVAATLISNLTGKSIDLSALSLSGGSTESAQRPNGQAAIEVNGKNVNCTLLDPFGFWRCPISDNGRAVPTIYVDGELYNCWEYSYRDTDWQCPVQGW